MMSHQVSKVHATITVDGTGHASDVSKASTASDAIEADADSNRSLLPPPTLAGGDALTEIAVLLAQSALTDRKESRMHALLDDRRAVAAGLARVRELRTAADKKELAAVAAAMGQIVNGGCGVYAGEQGANSAKGKSAEGWGAAADGAGKLLGAIWQHDADMAEAAAAGKDVESGSAVRAYDTDRADSQSARELYNRLVQAYRDIEQTRSASLLAAVRG